MKKFTVLFLISASTIATSLGAQESGLGVGIILGAPTGLSCKAWTTSSTAIDAAAAWSLGRRSYLVLHADYLLHSFGLWEVEGGQLPLYYGIGGRVQFRDNGDDRIGIRVPVGIDYLFAKAPLDVFLELAPLLDLVPETEFQLDAGVGIRYFF